MSETATPIIVEPATPASEPATQPAQQTNDTIQEAETYSKEHVQKLNNENAERRILNKQLTEKIAELEKSNATLTKKVTDMTEAEAKLAELEAEREKLTTEIDTLKADSEELKSLKTEQRAALLESIPEADREQFADFTLEQLKVVVPKIADRAPAIQTSQGNESVSRDAGTITTLKGMTDQEIGELYRKDRAAYEKARNNDNIQRGNVRNGIDFFKNLRQ